jgi:hypothetical protein
MSPSLKTGLVRVCLLLTFLWVAGVGGITLHESMDQPKLCSASDMVVAPACHQFFWKWQRPDETEDAKAPAKGDDQDTKDQGIHVHFGKINIDVQRSHPLEHHLNVEHLVMGLLLPLAAFWGIGFGVAWCVDGFRKKA